MGHLGAVQGYPLASLVYGHAGPNDGTKLCDTIFRHPVYASRQEVAELLPRSGEQDVMDRLTLMVQVRAHMISKTSAGTARNNPEADWDQARIEFCIPSQLFL